MTVQVLGAYATEGEAITAVDVHTLAGLREDKITLFANKVHADSLRDKTQVTIKSNQPEEEGHAHGFMDKVKEVFSSTDDYELHSRELLIDFGLSESEADQCLTDVEAGKVVMLADDEVRMGHDEEIIHKQ